MCWLDTGGEHPYGKPPDGYRTLRIAKEYGQPPHEVEKWDPYWTNRAWTLIVAASMHEKNMIEKHKK